MTSELRHRLLTGCAWIVLWAALFLFYAIGYKYHFFWAEQNQLFLNTGSYVAGYLNQWGWLSNLAADWLTQLYYYLYVGPALLSAIIAATAFLAYLTVKRFGNQWIAWAVAIIVFIWYAFASFGLSFRLSSVICLMGWLLLYQLTHRLRYYALLFIPVAAWLFGFNMYAKPVAPSMADERMFALDSEYYFGNYDKVIDLAKNAKNPNEYTSFYFYLAKAKQGKLPEALLEYPVKDLGTLTTIGEGTPLPIINMMNELYYELGDMTYAERAAMMRNVFSPNNRNARMVKRLAEVNLVSGDTLAAKKYLGILEKTLAYKQWAQDREPGKMKPAVENDILSRRARVNAKHYVRVGDNCYGILIELLESNPNNKTARDYVLCTSLLLRQMDTFKADYDKYCMRDGKPVATDPIYQQALMIYLAGTSAPQEEWERYQLPPSQYQRFVEYSRQRGNPAFADTYWYYFDRQAPQPPSPLKGERQS